MAKESIYHYITRMSEQNPGLPYSFQNVGISGGRDVKFLLWEDELSFLLKEKFAKILMDEVERCIESQEASNELRKALNDRPVFLYLVKFINRVKLYLSEKIIDEKKLYSFGIKLATKSEYEEEVKLGMLILGLFENDITHQILKILGYHSALTIYALEASKSFKHFNQFAFEIAQNTSGYGRLAALYMLEPLTKQQKLWILEQGSKNEVAPNLSSVMCLEKVDMAEFYNKCLINEANFSNFSHIIAYAFEKNKLNEITQSSTIVPKYINAAGKYARSFIDVAALTAVQNGMDAKWQETIGNTCTELLKHSKWINIALGELNEPENETSLIMMVLEKLDMQPSFDSFIPLFQRDLFDMNILKHMLMDNPGTYVEEVFGYLQNVLPEEIFTEGPRNIVDEDIDGRYKADIWLMYLLKTLRREKKNEESFFIRCLSSRLPVVRIEAIQALRVFKLNWSENVLPALGGACEAEPVKNIKKRLLRLIGKNKDVMQKEQRYVDVTGAQIIPHRLDVSLIDTEIAGTFFRDMLVVEGHLEEGDILYLLREPENKYDDKAILVAAEDGYVLGYIPKSDNAMPAAMMESGEKLYAVLKSRNVKHGKPEIKIMLSKRQKSDGKVIQFPFKL